MVESLWHLTISCLRPLWEWTSTGLTVFAFVMQALARVYLLVLSVLTCRALNREQGGARELRHFVRGLVVLFGLELIEMCLKFGEVHAVCDAAEVWAARARRGRNTSMSETMCEVISDVYDFAWGVIALVVLAVIIRVAHSHLRTLKENSYPPGQVKAQGEHHSVAEAHA
jgi:hypothetical protein